MLLAAGRSTRMAPHNKLLLEIHGDRDMMEALDALLRAFVQQRRMKIAGEYRPCYRVVT